MADGDRPELESQLLRKKVKLSNDKRVREERLAEYQRQRRVPQGQPLAPQEFAGSQHAEIGLLQSREGSTSWPKAGTGDLDANYRVFEEMLVDFKAYFGGEGEEELVRLRIASSSPQEVVKGQKEEEDKG